MKKLKDVKKKIKNVKWKDVLANGKIVADFFVSVAPIIKMLIVAGGTFALALMISGVRGETAMSGYIAEVNAHKKRADSALALAAEADKKVALYQETAKAAQDRAVLLEKKAATLSASVAATKGKVAQAKATLAEQETIADSMQVATVVIAHQDSVIVQQDSLIATKENANKELKVALANKESAIVALQTSTDSLRAVLMAIPKAPKDPDKTIFGIKKPSRTTTFVIGLTVGIIAGAALSK